MTNIFCLVFSALALVACGDNIVPTEVGPDGGGGNCFEVNCPTDGGESDAGVPNGESGSDGSVTGGGSDAGSGSLACAAGETLVCHFPPGNPDDRHAICVDGDAAVQAHLAHGDAPGACP